MLLYPLIPTPLTDEGKVDEKGLRKLIDFDLPNGCDGIGVIAAIGEGYLFGSNSQYIIMKASCPVLSVRREWLNLTLVHMPGRRVIELPLDKNNSLMYT
jgi:hypothetical protein